MAPGLRDPVVPGGAEPPRVEVGRVPPDVGVAGSQLVDAQRPGVAGANLSHGGPPRWCTTRCPVSSGWSSSVCTAMCGSCGTSVTTSRAVRRGSPRGPGSPAPTCTITHSVWSCACSVAQVHWSSVVTNHTGVGPWGREQRLGPSHIRVRLLVLTFREYVAEDVQEGRRWVVCRLLRGGG